MLIVASEFADVARLLDCKTFAEAEGMKLRGGRAVCPFHAGADGYNLAFYQRDGRCHCHKCGKTADVVGLAAAVWNVDMVTAARDLNERFRLGLTETMPTAERKVLISAREQARQDARDILMDACAEIMDALDAVNKCPPDTPQWWEALRQAKAAGEWWRFKFFEYRDMNGVKNDVG